MLTRRWKKEKVNMMDGRESGFVLKVARSLRGMNALFSPSSMHSLDLCKGVMRCLEDWKERLFWEGVTEACLRRHKDGGLGTIRACSG